MRAQSRGKLMAEMQDGVDQRMPEWLQPERWGWKRVFGKTFTVAEAGSPSPVDLPEAATVSRERGPRVVAKLGIESAIEAIESWVADAEASLAQAQASRDDEADAQLRVRIYALQSDIRMLRARAMRRASASQRRPAG